ILPTLTSPASPGGIANLLGALPTVQITNSTTNTLFSSGANPGSRVFNALDISGTGGITVGAGLGPVSGLPTSVSLTLASGALLVTGTGTDTLSAQRIAVGTLQTSTAPEAVLQIGAGATLNLGGTIVGSLVANQINATTTWYEQSSSPVYNANTGSGVTGDAASLTKDLGGTLDIMARQFYIGTTTLNGGTTILDSGTTVAGSTIGTINTLYDNAGALTVNYGATLDLNGTSQYIGSLSSNGGATPGAGGTITSSGGPAMLVTNQAGNTVWAGSITGDSINQVALALVSNNTITMESPNPYYGPTIVLNGTLALQDNATLANTSSILLNYGLISLNNNSDLIINNNDRINDAAPITMNGGALTLNGQGNTYTTETVGALTAASGANTISIGVGGNGLYSNADLTLASITAAVGATVNFTTTTTSSTLGAGDSNPRILVTNASTLGYNTSTGVIGAWAIVNSDTFAAYNPSLGIGAVGTDGYQSYAGGAMTGGTITTVNNVNIYAGGTLTGFGVGNVTDVFDGVVGVNNALTLPAGGANTDYLRLAGAAETDILFTHSSDVLNLNQGGLIHSNSSTGSSTIGSAAVPGVLTAGGMTGSGTVPLVIYNTANSGTALTATLTNLSTTVNVTSATGTQGLFAGEILTGTGLATGTYITSVLNGTQFTVNNLPTVNASESLTPASNMVINSVIADNGLQNLVQLEKSGTGTLTLTGAGGNNTYSGGTIVDEGTLNLDGTAGTVLIPAAGGLTIVGAPTAFGTATTVQEGNGIGGQIAAGTTVTIDGRSTLALAGNETLNSLVFNNNGGGGAPTVTVPAGTTLTLSNSSPITATSNNPSQVAIVSGGFLALNAGANTISAGPIQINGTTVTQIVPTLNISSVITGVGASITANGGGLLELSGANTFDSGVNLSSGGIEVGASSTPSTAGSTVTSGPLGIGTFNIGTGTYLVSSANTNAVANNLTLGANDLTLLGTSNLALNGNLSLNAGNTTINVDVPGVTLALGGVISDPLSGSGSLIKTGLGTLALDGNNTFTGSVTVNAGVVVLGGSAGGVAAPLANPIITITSTGTLALQNNGSGNNGLITYTGLNVTINNLSPFSNLFVGNNGANTGNTIEIPSLTMSGGQVLNLANANNYSLIIESLIDATPGVGPAPEINVPAGMTVYDYTYTSGDQPINTGLGNLIFPDVVTLGTTTTLNSGNPIELSAYNGSNYYPLVIQTPSPAPAAAPLGFFSGGLNASFASTGTAVTTGALNSVFAGIGYSGTFASISQVNDLQDNNRPLSTTSSFTTSIVSEVGLLDIGHAGVYTFRIANDDSGTLIIDGTAVLNDTTGAAIHQA
ncbi:MAG TPA: autotransporter-associated beta strand repeat-containing protein, partial [Pirellulales bacterium]